MRKVTIKFSAALRQKMVDDLLRDHPFAKERIGIAFSKYIQTEDDLVVFLYDYLPLQDDHYEKYKYGAKINSVAIRFAMEQALQRGCGLFHVHLHSDSDSLPLYSYIDEEGIPPLINSFKNTNRSEVHGSLLLNENEANALLIEPGEDDIIYPDKVICVDRPMQISLPKATIEKFSEKFNRQSFLGYKSEEILKQVKVCVIGLGGGGSHCIQQIAHLNFENVLQFDFDITEMSNLNRLVGATLLDALNGTPKTVVAERLYKALMPKGKITSINSRWEEHPDVLATADIVIGCVDSLIARKDLESHCRRYLIPYIDLGMDVAEFSPDRFVIGGQVILSLPSHLCMKCMSFLKDDELAAEGRKYGAAGGRPQVVWPNGILASTAIGLAVELCTGWMKDQTKHSDFLMYDGNQHTIMEDPRLRLFKDVKCEHFAALEIGPVKLFA